MRVLPTQIELMARDIGPWTNAGTTAACWAQLPPVNSSCLGEYVIYGVEPYEIEVTPIESGVTLVNGQEVDRIVLTAEQARGGRIAIRNILGKLWHATVIVPTKTSEEIPWR